MARITSNLSSSTRRKIDESGCTGSDVASVETSWWMRWARALPPVLSCCFDAWDGWVGVEGVFRLGEGGDGLGLVGFESSRQRMGRVACRGSGHFQVNSERTPDGHYTL